jgi:hypothetical protein
MAMIHRLLKEMMKQCRVKKSDDGFNKNDKVLAPPRLDNR